MTIQQDMSERLVENGLWDNEADQVIEKAKARPEFVAMDGRWDDKASGYPAGLLDTVFTSLKFVAVEHLKEVAPNHFALAILQNFDNEPGGAIINGEEY